MRSWAQDDPIRSIILSKDGVLERVDEYSLYCHYLGYEPIPKSGKYRSPIRQKDFDPSFGIFYSTKSQSREFLWKDQALGLTGDIFLLVQLMFQYKTSDEAVLRIIKDFGIDVAAVHDGNRIVRHTVPESFVTKISKKARPFTVGELEWWKAINIDLGLLERYFTEALAFYWLAEGQEVPYTAQEFTFSYRIADRFKIYQPFAPKDKKFRTNFTDKDVEGLVQLEFNQSLLVITKSTKDVIFLRSLGYEAIAPRSETTLIVPEILSALQGKYKQIVTLFDNDGKHKASEYPYPELHVPESTGYKDPTDVARYRSVRDAKEIIDSLLNQHK